MELARHRRLNDNPEGAPSRPDDATGSPRQAALTDAIEQQVVPALVAAHRRRRAAAPAAVTEADIEAVTVLAIEGSTHAILGYLELLRARGASMQTLYLDVLAAAARRLGALWEEDARDFTEVTIGTGRLREAMRLLAPDFRAEGGLPSNGRSVLLASTPGEQHAFGILMVTEFFRRAGWDAQAEFACSERQLVDIVRTTRFDAVALSLYAERFLDELAGAIRALRTTSCNPDLRVLVGGYVFSVNPELVAVVGADAAAIDAGDAVRQADALVIGHASRR